MTLFLEENLEDIKKLEASYPNNMEFGNNLRRLFIGDILISSTPNDQELGQKIRKLIRK
jgi:hypothetical protein